MVKYDINGTTQEGHYGDIDMFYKAKYIFFFIISIETLLGAQFGLIDRLVLEVDSFSYTQRQLELYIILKNILSKNKPPPLTLIDARNWDQALNEFQIDMLIEQEARRIGSVHLSDKTIAVARKIVAQRSAKDPTFRLFLEHVGADETTIRKTLITILIVRKFKIGKNLSRNNDSKANLYKWINALQSRIPYRIYEGAKKFEPIQSTTIFTNKKASATQGGSDDL